MVPQGSTDAHQHSGTMCSPVCLSGTCSPRMIQIHTTPLGQHDHSCLYPQNWVGPGHQQSVRRPYGSGSGAYDPCCPARNPFTRCRQQPRKHHQRLLSLQPQVGTTQPHSSIHFLTMGHTTMGSLRNRHQPPTTTILFQGRHRTELTRKCSSSSPGY